MAFGDFAIAPSTTVTLCKGVPLSKGSEDTILFGSASAQASTLSSYGFATFSNLTYQRNTRNVVRVGMSMGNSGANSALRANYLIFNNTAFEGKNIYAFVDQIDYVNNNTIDITFTIDAMQTFMFDFTLRECYVEREHSVTDAAGDNVVPEEFGALPTVINSSDEHFMFVTTTMNTKYDCVIYYIANNGVDPVDGSPLPANYRVAGRFANNVYVGASADIQPAGTAASGIDVAINDIKHRGGEIVNVQMIPHSIISATDGGTGIIDTRDIAMNVYINSDATGYTPRNKKLLTYPFNYIIVSNNSGEDHQYRWEWFHSNDGQGHRVAKFRMYGGYQPSPEAALVPMYYKNTSINYAEMITYTNFPSSAWSEDSYLNWRIRNSNSLAADVVSNRVGTISSMVSSALAGAAIGSAAGAAGTIAGAGVGLMAPLITGGIHQQQLEGKYKDAIATPDKMGGSASASVVNECIGCTGFIVYRMNIPIETAKRIDDYFTMYGYATQRVKTPNISSRPRFNYVKTQGCTIYGDIPAEFAKEIQERFNSGVRFWKPTATVGDYDSPNEP